MNRIAKVPGEAFDADQISNWRCDECGEDEYNCDCGPLEIDGEYDCEEDNSNDTQGNNRARTI